MTSNITKRQLPNGVRLLMEPMDSVRSASVGLWVDVGSRDEEPQNGGVCHVIEHMFFKGDARHDAFALNDAMNSLGGHFNAFTSQETTCIHARLIDEQLADGLDLLSGILLTSNFDAAELDRERNVILEEYKMVEDTPDDLVLDLFHQALWGDHPLGRSILGRPETIERFQRDDLLRFIRHEFTPERFIISVAGAFDPGEIEDRVRRLFADVPARSTPAASRGAPTTTALRSEFREKEIEQSQFCFGAPAPERASEERYAFALLNIILGGGMSSRVFREVREKRGLAYSIGSYQSAFHDAGGFGISGGTSPETLEEVIDICLGEIRSLYTDGCTPEELALAKQQMKTSLVFALENTGARMTRLAEQEIYFGRHIDPEESLRRVEAITQSDVQQAAETWLKNAEATYAMVGPANSHWMLSNL